MRARWFGFTVGVVAVVAVFALGAGVWAQGKWAAPPEAKNVKNPVAKSDKVIADAKKIAEANCVACHGAKRGGNLLEDLERPRPHAALEASRGEGPLGPGPLHPDLEEVVAGGVSSGLTCPLSPFYNSSPLSLRRLCRPRLEPRRREPFRGRCSPGPGVRKDPEWTSRSRTRRTIACPIPSLRSPARSTRLGSASSTSSDPGCPTRPPAPKRRPRPAVRTSGSRWGKAGRGPRLTSRRSPPP